MLLPVGGVPDARTKLLPSANEPIRYSADVVVAGGVVQASLFDDKRMAPLPPATQYRLNESPVLLFVTVYVPELFVTVAVPECTEVSCPFRRGVVSSSHDVVPNCVRLAAKLLHRPLHSGPFELCQQFTENLALDAHRDVQRTVAVRAPDADGVVFEPQRVFAD